MARTKASIKRKSSNVSGSGNVPKKSKIGMKFLTPYSNQSIDDKVKAKQLLNDMVNGATAYLNDENPLFFVKNSSGNVVSALMLKRNTPANGVVLIALSATRNNFQRLGLSSNLGQHAIQWAENQNFTHIVSEPISQKSELLLNKLGFKKINFKHGFMIKNGKLITNKPINNNLTLKIGTRIAPYARILKINEPKLIK